MKVPKPVNLDELVELVKDGTIRIPQFQREFVWKKDKMAALLDSIIKGYPIGFFIIWKTKEDLRIVRDISKIKPSPPLEGQYVHYVLDGQQRILTLLYSREGTKNVPRGKSEIDFSQLALDLTTKDMDEDIVLPPNKERKEREKEGRRFISFHDLMERKSSQVMGKYSAEEVGKIDDYKSAVEKFLFPLVNIERSISDAIEVFTRVNTRGQALNIFEIMVAKTFDQSRNFDLAEKFKEFNAESSKSGYEIKTTTLLQIMAFLLGEKKAKKSNILRLNKYEFINNWDKAVAALGESIDLFQNQFGIPASQFLPTEELFVPFAYYYFNKGKKERSSNEIKYLQDLFWKGACLSWQHRAGGTDQMEDNVETVQDILKGKTPPKYEHGVDISPQYIESSGVDKSLTGRYAKTILCLFASMRPREFKDGGNVSLDGSSLSRSNKHNRHHFFPKSFLSDDEGIDEKMHDHVANITFIGSANNQEFSSNPPSVYMKRCKKGHEELNRDLNETMKTHLIDLSWDAIEKDKYKAFIKKRCEKISEELDKRIELQSIDGQGVAISPDEKEDDGRGKGRRE